MGAPARAAATVLVLAAACGPGGTVTTIAGSTEAGHVDGPAAEARFHALAGIAVDRDGVIFVADAVGQAIRRIDLDGTVSTWTGGRALGFADGGPESARFLYPVSLALDRDGDLLVGEGGNRAIRRVDATTREVSTIAGGVEGYEDGPLGSARFGAITGIAHDPVSGVIYVCDFGNHAVRSVDEEREWVETVAGDGTPGSADGAGIEARFNRPVGLALDAEGTLWVADALNHSIRRIGSDGNVTTVAGSAANAGYVEGAGEAARFNRPWGITLADGMVYVADSWNHVVRAVDAAGGTRREAGDPSEPSPLPVGRDGPLDAATFRLPSAIAEHDGRLYVAESTRVRVIEH